MTTSEYLVAPDFNYGRTVLDTPPESYSPAMSLNSKLACLIQACLLSKDVPPYIRDVVNHHLSQQADVIVAAPENKMVVYYLGIDGVTTGSKGRGMFKGPLKSDTSQEKDILTAALNMPLNFRTRLARGNINVIVAVNVNEMGGESHALAVELDKADLVVLRARD